MTNPYQALTTYEGSDWEDYLESLSMLEVFGELFGIWTTPDAQRKIIRYIAWTYSKDSKKLMEGLDWQTNKRNLYDLAGLPANLWPDIGMLKRPELLKTVHRWLDFQGDAVFKQLQVLRDLKAEMQESCAGMISKNGEGIDYDQKMKNARYAHDLDLMIQALETKSIINHPALKEAVRESGFTPHRILSGPEHFAK